MSRFAAAFVCTLILAFTLSQAHAEDWPGWRGPRADGTVTDTGFAATWSATENVKWKTEFPAPGTRRRS